MNDAYKRAVVLKGYIKKDAENLKIPLNRLMVNLEEFYHLMRYANLDVSTEQYERLYNNCIYDYEDNHIDYLLEVLCTYLKELTEKDDNIER